MTQCASDLSRKDSDLRFILRLIASWGLFLTLWICIIFFSTTGVIGICMFVGHHFNNLTGMGNEPLLHLTHSTFETHNTHLMILDTSTGVLVLITLGLVLAILFWNGYYLKYHHYDPWYILELRYIQEQATNTIRKEEPLIAEFSELDGFDNGKPIEFWHTIPEYLKLKHYYDKICPRCSIQRYLCWATFYTSIDTFLLFLGLVVLWYVGSKMVCEGMFTDNRTGREIGGISMIFIQWAFGFFTATVIAGILAIIWNCVIISCIEEWRIHQERKYAKNK